MVFETGSATAVHNTTGVGVGLGSGVSIGLGVGGAQTTTTSISALAEKAAPPALKKTHWLVWSIGVGGPAFAVCASSDFEAAARIVALCAGALCLYLMFLNWKWNKNEYPPLMAQWERSWMCHKCGNIFVQD